MAATDWIPCRIHPTHPKVLAVANMTGDSPAEACGKCIAWFWHVDQTYEISQTYLDINAFHNVVLSPRKRRNKCSYFEAMSHETVGWVALDADGKVVVCDYENNFSKSSKRRAQTRKRVQRHRAAKARGHVGGYQGNVNGVTNSATASVTKSAHVTQPKKKEERINKQASKPPGDQSVGTDVERRGGHVTAVAADCFPPDPELCSDVLDLYGEVEISLNQRTRELARLAADAWGDEAAGKLAHICQRCLDSGKGQGIMVEEMELAANAKVNRDKAMQERRQRLQASPVVGMTPEQTKADQMARLKAHGWRAVRRAIRDMDLYRRPSVRRDSVFQAEVLRCLARQQSKVAS